MKLHALPELFDVIGNNEIRHFTCRSRETIRDMFLVIGQVMLERILKKLTEVRYVGLLCDNVTDIAVMEQFITFIQFVDPETASLETKFLFVENAFEKSNSADAETLFKVLCSKLDTLGIEVDKVSSLASDGAAAMLGKNSGLATRLKESNAKILGIHCICHRLALACTDSNKDVEYVANVEDILRQLWKYLENSPKRMATYLKVQQDKKTLDLSQKGKRVITKKLKKACKTRWLSFDSAAEAIFDELEAVMKTLTILESDATAVGLLKKNSNPKFVGCLYILKHVLPSLIKLYKAFQRGSVNFSNIKPSIAYTKQKLNTITEMGTPVKEFAEDFETGGRRSCLEICVRETDIQQQETLLKRYTRSLMNNIDARFESSLPVLDAFSVF